MNSKHGKTALVIGGSLAGLLAARVLSDYFERVIIIERDLVHDVPEARKGQAQARHLHGLLVQGLQIITRYFPDLLEGLQSGGTPILDMAQTMRWFTYGGYRSRFELGMKGIITSRPFLEWHIRQRLLALTNVAIKDGYAVEKLLTDDTNKKVIGLQVVKHGKENEPEQLYADLVVDASGRGSRSPKWLEEIGYAKPAESTVTCGTGYATRLYQRDKSHPGNQDWIFITPQAPQEYKGGAALPIEHDKWIVSLGGWHGQHAPTDEAGFNAFAKSLPAPDVYNIITTATPLSEIVTYRYPASQWRHYEDLSHFPEGYLVLGDAVCSLNPLYGQGMTSAALQSAALEALLQKQPNLQGIYKPYFKQIAKIVAVPWQMAVGEDFRFPETRGKKAPGTDFINAYMNNVHRATHHDPVVGAMFLKVMNLLEPPTKLMSPPILWRVIKSMMIKRRFNTSK